MAANAMHNVGSNRNKRKLSFFGTDGIRGNAATLLSSSFVRQIGFCCSPVLKEGAPILIGQDSRSSSSRIASDLTYGLTSAGREVWELGLCTTPAVPYLIKKHNCSGGIMISASHNPPQDNGIKIFDANGQKISLEKQYFLENMLQEEILPSRQKGKYFSRNNLLEGYENSLVKGIESEILKDISIVIDLCWGSATACGEKVFKSLGANVTAINSMPDGKKINVNCGSTHLENIKQAVKDTGSEIGFAFDGDADRMIAIDRHGRVLDGDHVLYLWGSYLEEKNSLPQKKLVATSMSNLAFEKAWIKKEGILIRTAVGDKHVYKAMIKNKASLGGEQSGHILSTINGLSGDGIFTAIKLSEICHHKKLNPSELLNESFKPYPQILINTRMKQGISIEHLEGSDRFQRLIKQAQIALKDEGRIFIRQSGTEPILRILIESHDLKLVKFWEEKFTRISSEEFC